MERRSFFRELIGQSDRARGRYVPVRRFRLEDFPRLPDSVLADIVPTLVEGVALVGRDQRLSAKRAGSDDAIDLGGSGDLKAAIVERFDGTSTLSAIAAHLASSGEQSPEQSFAVVKDVFLECVRLRVSVPAHSLPVRQRVTRSIYA